MTSPDELMRAVSRIGTLQAGRRYVWRGVADHRYRVRSSLVRRLAEDLDAMPTERQVRARELALIREARAWGLELAMGTLATDLHMLAFLQHHGVPTRLLDVTSNPMTALWFACQSRDGRDSSGALFAFDVTGLPEYLTVEPGASPTWGSIDDPLGWPLTSALARSTRDRRAFLLRPSLPDARMQAQEGLFISGTMAADSVVGVDGIPMTDAPAPGGDALAALFGAGDRARGRPRTLPFCVLVIAPTLKRRLLPHLQGTYNRAYRNLFPDVDGFRDALGRGGVELANPDNLVDSDDEDTDGLGDPT